MLNIFYIDQENDNIRNLKYIVGLILYLSLVHFLTSCSPVGNPNSFYGSQGLEDDSNNDHLEAPPDEGTDNGQNDSNSDEFENLPPENEFNPIDYFCSDLSLIEVIWPISLTNFEKFQLALALNITGSYEGNSGWTNITNDFDGQGMSLGLLQQNFGQGSLQPLLINFFKNNHTLWNSIFSNSHSSRLVEMLTKWNGGVSLDSLNLIHPQQLMNELPESNWMDIEYDEQNKNKINPIRFLLLDKNQESVDWARSNLYTDRSNRSFDQLWKEEFIRLSGHPKYVSIQIESALLLFNRALSYVNKTNLKKLKSFLFFFDIVVQNGGINNKYFKDFEAWLVLNENSSEEEQLTKILELRLAGVKPQYRDDVFKRKMTIITGEGVVHGSRRNLPEEYCYDSNILSPN